MIETIKLEGGAAFTFDWADVLAVQFLPGPHTTILIRFKYGTQDVEIFDTTYSYYEHLAGRWRAANKEYR